MKLIALRFALLALVVLAARPVLADDAWLASQKHFYQIASDHAAVDRLLGELHRRYPDFQQRLRAVVLLRIGTPYVLGCLGEEKPPDRDPVFRLDESDCTVHCLTSSALAHATTYAGARAMMRVLNYYPGPNPIRFANRIHFTEDRLATNPYFRNVTAQVALGARLAQVTLTLNRKADGQHLIEIPWQKRMTVRYLRVRDVTPAVLARLPRYVAGVAFVRRKMFPLGLAVSHEATIVDRRWLVHADSIRGRTVKLDFLPFLLKNSDYFDGVIFYKFL